MAASVSPSQRANNPSSVESTDELTEEERRFIEENLVGGILHDDSASSPRVSDDDEYNKDYEQFLAKSTPGKK